MPRNLIYCMCWYFTWQHFMVLKIHYLTHRLINVNIFDEQRTWDDWVTIWTSHLWRAVNGMPRNLIYCMCWYCTLQHFLVFKIHYLTHRLLNVNIFRWAEVVRWLSNILSWSGVTSCQWNAEKSHLLHVLVFHLAALHGVKNTLSYSSLAQFHYFSSGHGR